MKILRWIFCVPIAVLVAGLAYYLIVTINIFTFSSYTGLDPNNILFLVWLTLVSNLSFGAIFVMIGSYVAPNSKKGFSVVLSVLLGILSGFGLFGLIVNNRYWEIAGIIIANVGSIGFTIEKYKQQNENWPFEN